MVNPVSPTAATRAAEPVHSSAAARHAAPPRRQADTDSIQLSSTAQAHLSAAKAEQQAHVAPVQTAKKTGGGDLQPHRPQTHEANSSHERAPHSARSR